MIFLALPAHAQSGDEDEIILALSKATRAQIMHDPDRFVESAIRKLYKITGTGILTQDAVDARRAMDEAQMRATFLSRAFAFDLDGNLSIDEEEVTRQKPHLDSNSAMRLDNLLAQADRDKNGSLALDEIMAHVSRLSVSDDQLYASHRELMQFDADRDGQVTPEEIASVVARIADSGDVKVVVAPPVPRLPRNILGPVCDLPPASDAASVLLIGGYEGDAISTVAVSGLDRATSVATINVEPGAAPLYIVATAFDSIIWKVVGETSRVERFVAVVNSGAGVEGLSKAKVRLVPKPACGMGYFTADASGDAFQAKAQLAAHLKRSVDLVLGAQKLGTIDLPSGSQRQLDRDARSNVTIIVQDGVRFLKTASGLKPIDGPMRDETAVAEMRLLRRLERFYPGGIKQVDPSKTVGSSRPQIYDVLPQQAGVLQLVRDGSLTFAPDGYFVVTKTIPRFPADLNGGHSVKFKIAAGVEVPAGSPGHSTVLLQETGECISRVCR